MVLPPSVTEETLSLPACRASGTVYDSDPINLIFQVQPYASRSPWGPRDRARNVLPEGSECSVPAVLDQIRPSGVTKRHDSKSFGLESGPVDISGDGGATYRIAEPLGTMSVSMIVQMTSINEVGTPIQDDREVASFAWKTELALSARGVDHQIPHGGSGTPRCFGSWPGLGITAP